MEELKALIAIKMCDGIGDITANKLITACGSASAVFEEKSKHLSDISGISHNVIQFLEKGVDWSSVDKEVEFIEKNHISHVSIVDPNYPQRLIQTDSPPPILFFLGPIESLNSHPCISIVGTRKPTSYGLEFVEKLVAELTGSGVIVISGLAHGIDIASHRSCVKNHVSTFGIVGHGLKTIYPAGHRESVKDMINAGGGMVSDFFSEEIPNRENFPKRNRIIAGLSSATIVVEASHGSGTLITADYSLSYKRKVFALPGRFTDKLSEGCNHLLSKPSVKPILSIQQLIDDLGLNRKIKKTGPVIEVPLESDEVLMMNLFSNFSRINLDDVSSRSQWEISKCTSILFNLEMKGLIRSLPGKTYELCPL